MMNTAKTKISLFAATTAAAALAIAGFTRVGTAGESCCPPVEGQTTQIAYEDDMAKGDIVEVATKAGQFNTLTTALTEAGLVDTLKGDGPFTVFAPTDEAFDKLPEGALDGLLQDKEQLKKVLLGHVVKGKAVKASQVTQMDGQSVETAAGNSVQISVKDGEVMLGDAKVVKTDVAASNGVIHAIDTVIMP